MITKTKRRRLQVEEQIEKLREFLEPKGWSIEGKAKHHIKLVKSEGVFLNYYPTCGKIYDRSSCNLIATSFDHSEILSIIERAHKNGQTLSDHELDVIPENADCVVYTDGSTYTGENSITNENMGYCAIVVKNNKALVWSEQGVGTNNMAELKGVELGLKRAYGDVVAIVTDSQLAKGWCNGTFKIKNAIIREIVKEVKNRESLFSGVVYIKTKGHSKDDNYLNDLADTYAKLAATGNLFNGVEIDITKQPQKKRKKKCQHSFPHSCKAT